MSLSVFHCCNSLPGVQKRGREREKKGQGPTITNSFQTDKHCFIQKTSAQDTAPGWHPPTYTGRPTFPPYPFNPTFNHHGGQTIAPCHRLETKARSKFSQKQCLGERDLSPSSLICQPEGGVMNINITCSLQNRSPIPILRIAGNEALPVISCVSSATPSTSLNLEACVWFRNGGNVS